MCGVKLQAVESVQDLGSARKVIQNLPIPVAPETIMRLSVIGEHHAASDLLLYKDVHGALQVEEEPHLLQQAAADVLPGK